MKLMQITLIVDITNADKSKPLHGGIRDRAAEMGMRVLRSTSGPPCRCCSSDYHALDAKVKAMTHE